MSSSSPSDKGKRGIDSIAHLFLSQSKRPPARSPVHRQPPPSGADESAQPQQKPEQEPDEPAPAEVLITAHLKQPLHKAGYYAGYLTRRGDRIFLVNVDCYEAALIRLESLSGLPQDDRSDPAQDNSIVLCESEDIHNALIPTLTETAWECDNLLINIDPSFAPRTAELIARFSHVTILTECGKDSIIEAYQAVKKWAGYLRPDQELGLFVCEAPDHETADEVYYKIADTTRQFLKKVIIPAGCHISPAPLDELSVTGFDAPAATPPSEPAASLPEVPDEYSVQPALLDSHIDQLTSPVQPVPENQADSTPNAWPAHPVIPGITPAMPASPSEPLAMKPAETARPEFTPTASFPPIFSPVRVTRLPQNDAELLQTLQLHLSSWLLALPAVLPVPFPCFDQFEQPGVWLLDATGRFHILLATLNPAMDLLQPALEYRHWLEKNKTGLARMFAQLHYHPALETGLVLVKPNFTAGQKTSGTSLPGIPCLPLSLSFLDIPPQKALLITPAS